MNPDLLPFYAWTSFSTSWTSQGCLRGGRSEGRGAPAWSVAPLFSLLDLRIRPRGVLPAPPAARRHERYLARLPRRHRRGASCLRRGDGRRSAGGRGRVGAVDRTREARPARNPQAEQEMPDGCDRELHEIFLVCDATPPGDLRLPEGGGRSQFRLDSTTRKHSTSCLAPAREYAEGRTSATRIHLTEFVPKEEGYLRKVAGAARLLLSGTPPDPTLRRFARHRPVTNHKLGHSRRQQAD